jgi:hypothetical protein
MRVSAESGFARHSFFCSLGGETRHPAHCLTLFFGEAMRMLSAVLRMYRKM